MNEIIDNACSIGFFQPFKFIKNVDKLPNNLFLPYLEVLNKMISINGPNHIISNLILGDLNNIIDFIFAKSTK